jgi:hypothetical protein
MDPRVPRLIELVRQHELYFTEHANDRPELADVEHAFFADVWNPFYEHFVRLSDHDIAVSIDGFANELSRIRAIAAINGIATPDMGTSQHGYTALTSAGEAMSTAASLASSAASYAVNAIAADKRQEALGAVYATIASSPVAVSPDQCLVYGEWSNGHVDVFPITGCGDRFAEFVQTWKFDRGVAMTYAALFSSDGRFIKDWWPGSEAATTTSGDARMFTPATIVGRRHYARPVPVKDHLVNIAPVLAPGAGGISVKLSLHGTTLVADVCIDGKDYRGQADLSPFAEYLDDRLSRWHQRQHRQVDLVPAPRGARFRDNGKPLMGAGVDADLASHPVIGCCGEALVGALVEQHQREFCGGWWHNLMKDVDKAYKDVRHTVISTVKSLKGPLEAMASAAVSAAAMAIPGAGPLIAPIAGNLTKNLVDAATGTGSVKQAAQQALAQAAQAAQTDPNVAQALQLAQKAVAQGAVVTQTAQTVADAASGNPAAVQQVAQLAQAAAGGDPAAQTAIQTVQNMPSLQGQLAAVLQQIQQAGQQATAAVSNTASQAAAQLQAAVPAGDGGGDGGGGGGGDGGSDGGGATVSSGDSPRLMAMHLAEKNGARVVGVVLRSDGAWDSKAFPSSDDADDWYGEWLHEPHSYLYIAYFDRDASWPYPENEQISPHAPGGGTSVSGGPWMPMLFTPIETALTALLAAGGGYMYGHRHPQMSGYHAAPGQQPQVGAGFLVPALAAAGGFAAGRWGGDAWQWVRDKWEADRAKKAAGG